MMLRLFSWLLVLCPALPAMAQQGALEVQVKRVEGVFEVASQGVVKATPFSVWRVLTDYERMPQFVPDLQSSKLLARSLNTATVEQQGVARYLFLKRAIHLIVQVTEQPMASIDIQLISGDMQTYACRWELDLVPETGGTRIRYSGRMQPKFYVPTLIGVSSVRGDIERMMAAVLARLEREP